MGKQNMHSVRTLIAQISNKGGTAWSPVLKIILIYITNCEISVIINIFLKSSFKSDIMISSPVVVGEKVLQTPDAFQS